MQSPLGGGVCSNIPVCMRVQCREPGPFRRQAAAQPIQSPPPVLRRRSAPSVHAASCKRIPGAEAEREGFVI